MLEALNGCLAGGRDTPAVTGPLTLSLVGMPGCGKSTVGRHLSRHLGLRYVDSDHEIERRLGLPITSISPSTASPPSAMPSRR